MQNRRHRFKPSYNNMDTLTIIKRVLQILIAILLIVFIFSSIRMKKSFSNKKTFANNIHSIETSENNQINTSNESNISIDNNIASENNQSDEPKKESKSTSINIALIGDITCPKTICKDAYNSDSDTYDFSYIFEDIKYNIQTADISIGNLETTFAGSSNGYSNSNKFNAPERLATNLKKLGIDVLTTANNHSFDYGYSGIESTINYLDEADIAHTGTFKSEEEQNKILIQNVKGINIAILSYTYGTNKNTFPSDKSYTVNLLDKDLI